MKFSIKSVRTWWRNTRTVGFFFFISSVADPIIFFLYLGNSKAEAKLAKLRKRLQQLNAELDTPLEEVIDRDCASIVRRLYDFNKNLLTEAIKYVENNDLKIGEILNNIGNFCVKFATKLDEYKV